MVVVWGWRRESWEENRRWESCGSVLRVLLSAFLESTEFSSCVRGQSRNGGVDFAEIYVLGMLMLVRECCRFYGVELMCQDDNRLERNLRRALGRAKIPVVLFSENSMCVGRVVPTYTGSTCESSSVQTYSFISSHDSQLHLFSVTSSTSNSTSSLSSTHVVRIFIPTTPNSLSSSN